MSRRLESALSSSSSRQAAPGPNHMAMRSAKPISSTYSCLQACAPTSDSDTPSCRNERTHSQTAHQQLSAGRRRRSGPDTESLPCSREAGYAKRETGAASHDTWSCIQARARHTVPDSPRQQFKTAADTFSLLTWGRLQARARCEGPDAHHVQACLLRKPKQVLHWVVLASLVLTDHGLCSLVQVEPAAGSAAAVSLVCWSSMKLTSDGPLSKAQPWFRHAPHGNSEPPCIQ